jgi:hypothetical protein
MNLVQVGLGAGARAERQGSQQRTRNHLPHLSVLLDAVTVQFRP